MSADGTGRVLGELVHVDDVSNRAKLVPTLGTTLLVCSLRASTATHRCLGLLVTLPHRVSKS